MRSARSSPAISEDAVVEDTDRSVTYGPGWVDGGPDEPQQRQYRRTERLQSNAGPIVITTPANFAGGTVVLHGVASGGPSGWSGDVYLDGDKVGSFAAAVGVRTGTGPIVCRCATCRRARA